MPISRNQCRGKPCTKIQKSLESSDRLLAYRIDDIWRTGQKMTNPQQYLTDHRFISASKQFLAANTPIKDLMFRHTRDTLREYFKRGFLDKDVPTREVFDNAIVLEPNREVHLYIAVSDYVRHFYRLAQKENRKALGFLMTLYRKRLTSSFYAIEKSLQRRLDYLVTQQGSLLGDDDLSDLDDADDAIIEGLESYMEPIDPQEIQYLQDLLHQFDNTGEDTKRSQFINKLRQESLERDSAIIFTQYTDTMDYLRDTLQTLLLQKAEITFEKIGEKVWQMTQTRSQRELSYQVTFYPDTFDERPSLRLMTFGDPLFEMLLQKTL